MTLLKDYFEKTKHYKELYGEKTLLLMQVGAFYEVYGLKNQTTGEISGSNIELFSQFCDLAISDKKVCVGSKSVVMSGFRDYVLDKYIKKIQDAEFTAVVYSQDENTAGTTRSLTGIYSPGTFFNIDSNKITNNVMCIWIQKYKETLVFGLSNIDIFTGKSSIYEYQESFSQHCTSYDEIERYVSIYNPSEVIFIHNLSNSLIQNIIQYSSIATQCIHNINLDDESTNSQKANNCEKQIYQKTIINKFFNETSFSHNFNFITYPLATQSLCYLLEFIYEHNPNLVKQIELPIFENCSDRLLLGNHSLKQLNIINTGMSNGKISSVLDFMNMCITSMGKRKLASQLVNPIFDIEKLNKEYSIIDYLNENTNLNNIIRNSLKSIKDIEKLNRKLILKKITPQDLYYLYNNLVKTNELYENYVQPDSIIYSFISGTITPSIISIGCLEICSLLKDYINMDKAKEINNLDFETNFINPNIDIHFDEVVSKWNDSFIILKEIQNHLNNLIKPFENNNRSQNKEYVKIHHTDKMGYSLIATKRRIAILKEQLKNKSSLHITYKSWNDEEKYIELNVSSFDYKNSTASNYTIESPEITSFCKSILFSQKNLSLELEKIYNKLIDLITVCSSSLNEIIKFISYIDCITTKSHIAIKYNYCKPIIDKSQDSSFLNIEGLRHPLIENLLENELYITNDLNLNENLLGILLYGTNAVGKSSFIKSIGISIILAQSGFFVPCSKMNYYPYKSIFTRILGNDNLFKGLSTFAVEMLELKTILEKSNQYSLILGDELCSGTETDSAISIFLAGIDKLYQNKSNFIFATHFHEITNYSEIMDKSKIKLKHMAVKYDKTNDKLVYNRKLEEGSGESMYGLEVCKSLYLPDSFLNLAHSIRNKYNKKENSILNYKSSHFNSKILKGKCQLCKENLGNEVHHLQHQADADLNGFIDSFHKNHRANLLCVCDNCHEFLHKSKNGHKWMKTSNGYELQEIL